MKRSLRVPAVILAPGGVALGLAAGGMRGWTRTSAPAKATDGVTGLEAAVCDRPFETAAIHP